jgi:membrane-associated phospholipid phosphatase
MNNTQNIASWVSKLSEPMVLVIGLLMAGAWRYGVRGLPFFLFSCYVLFFFLVSLFLRMYAVKKLDTNWDLSDRKKRVQSFIPFFGICAVFFSCMLVWQNSGLTGFGVGLLGWLLGFALITLRTKISGHMAILTLTLGYCIVWFGAYWLTGLIFLPLVAWSRLVLKRHTLVEVIGGILYSSVFLLFFTMFITK